MGKKSEADQKLQLPVDRRNAANLTGIVRPCGEQETESEDLQGSESWKKRDWTRKQTKLLQALIFLIDGDMKEQGWQEDSREGAECHLLDK